MGSETKRPESGDDETFLRELVFPEEDRRLFTTAAWSGGFRWFRSPNVVPIEKYRDLKLRLHARSDST
jgi:hypothetical protein